MLGKTNTPEFGAGANTRNAVWGATGNPFDPTRSAAGSSGGSAVALACGMVPLATGSDTGGSLRNPAAFNGVVGFRPSPGLVPSERACRGLAAAGYEWAHGPHRAGCRCCCWRPWWRRIRATRIPARSIRRRCYPVPPVDLASLRVAVTPDFGFAPVENGPSSPRSTEKTARFRHVFRRADDTTPDCTGRR